MTTPEHVICPTCGAWPNESCHTRWGAPRRPHPTRRLLGSRAQELPSLAIDRVEVLDASAGALGRDDRATNPR